MTIDAPAREPAWVRRRMSLAVLNFIRAEVAAGRGIPGGTQIAAHMGWLNANSGRDALMRLAARGYLDIESRRPSGRGWRYVYKLRGTK